MKKLKNEKMSKDENNQLVEQNVSVMYLSLSLSFLLRCNQSTRSYLHG